MDVQEVIAALYTAEGQPKSITSLTDSQKSEAFRALLSAIKHKPHAPENRHEYLRALKLVLRGYTGPVPGIACETLVAALRFGSPSSRKLAASCLLQIVSIVTSVTLQLEHEHISRAALSILSDFQSQATRETLPLSAVRAATLCLRIMSVMTPKTGAQALKNLQEQVNCIQYWSHFGSITPSTAGRQSDRELSGSSGPRGPIVTNQLGAYSSQHRGPVPRRPSVESMITSESELDAKDSPQARSKENAQSRLDALSYLRAIAEVDSGRVLYPYWGTLLPSGGFGRWSRPNLMTLVESDPVFAVRVRACQVIRQMLCGSEGYLRIAEERSTKASFTSLSAKLALTIADMHNRLSRMLSNDILGFETAVELLELVRILFRLAPYHRLASGLLPGLAASVFCAFSTNDSVVRAACTTTLTDAFNKAISVPSMEGAMEPVALKVISYFKQIDINGFENSVWQLLKATVPYAHDADSLRSLVLSCDEKSSIGDSLGFLAAVVSKYRISSYLEVFRRIAKRSATSSIKARTSLCECLSEAAASVEQTLLRDPELEKLVVGLASDPDPSIRDAVIRILGLSVRVRPLQPDDGSWVTRVSHTLARIRDGDPPSTGLSWSLGNCGDAWVSLKAVEIVMTPDLHNALLYRAIEFASDSSAQSTRINGIRLCGAMLKLATEQYVQRTAEAIDCLHTALTDGGPKTQWNAATSLGSAFSNNFLDCSTTFASVAALLSSSKVYKVKIQLCLAIKALQAVSVDPETLITFREAIAASKVALAEATQIPPKEWQHALQLREELDKAKEHVEGQLFAIENPN